MKNTARFFAASAVCLILTGCLSGDLDYIKPSLPGKPANAVTVDKSKNEVWKEIVPALGKEFFVINNIDKESGLINISYSGDPEKYIDCGRITSHVENARGPRTYDFPASIAYKDYESVYKGQLFFTKRKMDLNGRMNLIVQEIAPNKTLVTANTKYIVTKKYTNTNVQGQSFSDSSSITFNSGQSGTFQSGTMCNPTGKFEEDVLSLISK